MQKIITFFLIDDDLDDQEFFMLALRDINPEIKCIMAKDGCEALEIIKKNKDFIPDFIFLDLNMPRVNGKECLVEMKKIEQLKNTPIYIYSTSSTNRDKIEMAELGAKSCIKKPCTIKELVSVLSQVISATDTQLVSKKL